VGQLNAYGGYGAIGAACRGRVTAADHAIPARPISIVTFPLASNRTIMFVLVDSPDVVVFVTRAVCATRPGRPLPIAHEVPVRVNPRREDSPFG
jgi:hypothetical protein